MTVTAAQVLDALRKNSNVLLYGPPGTGKTHLMHEVAVRFMADIRDGSASSVIGVDTEAEEHPFVPLDVSDTRVRWVTFHQGYSYEDFVIGLRPATSGDKLLALEPQPGLLLELAAEVLSGADAGLLLIDEINRGNASRIFGEFITLLEPDKRLGADGEPTPTTVTVSLPYLGPEEGMEIPTANGGYRQDREFRMPARVYTLASMNSVDKSVAPIDTALRRRFHVIGLSTLTADVLKAVGLDSVSPVKPPSEIASRADVASVAAQALLRLNHGIGLFLGPEFSLGQWYLAALGDSEMTREEAQETLREIWLYRLLPQLVELFHGRIEQLTTILRIEELADCPGLKIDLPRPDEEDLGATAFVSSRDSSAETVLSYLARFARSSEAPTDSAE